MKKSVPLSSSTPLYLHLLSSSLISYTASYNIPLKPLPLQLAHLPPGKPPLSKKKSLVSQAKMKRPDLPMLVRKDTSKLILRMQPIKKQLCSHQMGERQKQLRDTAVCKLFTSNRTSCNWNILITRDLLLL